MSLLSRTVKTRWNHLSGRRAKCPPTRRATRDPQKAHLWYTPNMCAEDSVKIRRPSKLAELCSGYTYKNKKEHPEKDPILSGVICKLQKSRCFAAPVLPSTIREAPVDYFGSANDILLVTTQGATACVNIWRLAKFGNFGQFVQERAILQWQKLYF